jgi:hypothetical protein
MDPKKFPQRQISVHTATHKYIWAENQSGKLYDLRSDPDENFNLINTDAPAEQSVLKKLKHAMETWNGKLQYFTPNRKEDVAQVDPVTLERLRNLGYVE